MDSSKRISGLQRNTVWFGRRGGGFDLRGESGEFEGLRGETQIGGVKPAKKQIELEKWT